MALFSDVDWIILLGVAAFLLFGQRNGEVLRTVGRYYGRAMRLKQEILADFTKAADLPLPAPGQPISIRSALLGIDAPMTVSTGIPAAVTTPPVAPFRSPVETYPWTGPAPTTVWSMTVPAVPSEREGVP